MTRMTKITAKRVAMGAAGLALLAACVPASAHEPTSTPSGSASVSGTAAASGTQDHQHNPGSGSASGSGTATAPSASGSTTAAPAGRPGTVKVVRGTPIANIRTQAAPPETSAFCDASDLPAGEGVANKGNTCVSTPLGEIAARPVRVTATTSPLALRGKAVKVKILVADNQGVLDLNAFTFDATGGAGVTLHEHPGELDANGRPLAHCHLGVTTLARAGALPGEDYDAAFSGIQGFKGDLTAEITGLPKGTYRGDVFCSVPGHPILPTNVATRVQAFDTFDFRVIGR